MIGFQKAPLGFDIIGEGTALVVADAGGLALFLADILHGSKIEAEIVAIHRRLYPPFLRGKRRAKNKR
ncbi:hypothetical protein D3C87_2135340 [compost metagenome]